ncbi:LacI family transcriptional regulator [Yinghuangia sp. ASG 101]|uniref:LacI family DNA-binding transcriptional regulator n=1 Tax=Yinghuangia sp. ASG 101 TaxID=2896848 RepID=UPI001E57CD17|nr:LacI family DNA-binding transcriptional regulator [Yinghuangia sp. ASG 101]UGQ14883.1 LacI family transcriptional regulator [Yinghuangia sp. ASG 101]
MKTRLADIAAQAGVSEATVSRVLNSRPGVAEDTRRAVLTALDVLGYERPARLRRRSAGLVGLMLPELDNPIFPAFAQVIERALAHHGYTPVLCTGTPGGATEDDYTELLLERGVSGIIFVSGLHSDAGADMTRYIRLVERGLPVVFVNGFAEGVDAPFISSDESVAVELAIGHLASLRHRAIGLAVGPERYVPTARKIAGFRRGLAATFGVDADRWIERSLFSVEGGQAAAGALLDRGVTAVVCGSDLMALGVIRAVRERGLTVPGDVSVVGYDDSPLVAFTDPPLTTVRQAVAPMGAAAVRALLDEIGGGRAPRSEFLYRPELVVRGSTGPAKADAGAPADAATPVPGVVPAPVAGASRSEPITSG